LIIAVLASQTLIWHSLASIRDAIQQTNAIVLAACGSDDRPCQVAARRGQIELGEIMVRSRATDGFSVESAALRDFDPTYVSCGHDQGHKQTSRRHLGQVRFTPRSR
jgi:hypothetical protein